MKTTTFKRAIIAIAMMLVTAAAWAYDFSVNGIYYRKYSDGKRVYVTYKDTDYNSYSGSVVIPSTVTYSGTTYSVTSVGINAFKNCSVLTSVTIPNSVTSIEHSAFSGCSGLTSVTIPNSVTSIGGGAFRDCSGLTSVTIPNSVTSIDNQTFSGCSGLTSVTIPNSVTSIGGGAFSNCSGLTSVTIPNSVTSIGESAFEYCSGLTSVTIPNSVTSIGDYAFRGCSGLTKVEISDIAAWCKISFDDVYANPLYYAEHLYLNGKEVTNLVIPNSVTSIGNSAFYNCSGLTSVTIGNSVTSIGIHAFNECIGLTSVTIPNSVTSIGDYAFYKCSGLTSVAIGNSVTSIGIGAFYNCSGLTKVEISDIAAWCNISFGSNDANPLCYAKHLYLNGKEVTNLVIPNSVTSIGGCAFWGCIGLTSVTIPNSVTSIGEKAFQYCRGLTSVTIPNSVTSIGSYAYSGSSNLELVRLDATIITAPDEVVFGSYKSLTFIVGGNVKSIPKNIVANGDWRSRVAKVVALVDIPPTATTETFDSDVTSNATLYVKKNSTSKYVLADGWGDFNNIQSISNPITNISIDKTSINLGVGETIQLKATVLPTDATLTDVIWTSSNSCVSVDEKGNVIGLSVGQSVVTAEAIDGSGVKAECIVNVGNIYAQSISLSQKEVTMDINGLTKLSYTILPENVTIKDVEWSSSNTSVANFKVNTDKTINVVGINNGTAYITARTTDGTNLTATCVFYVGDAGAETIDSDSLSVTAAGGAIRVEGAEGAEAEVYSLSGALLYRGTDSTIALPRGVYIVKVAGTTTKVIL